MTLMNLASLAIFVVAMTMGRFGYQHQRDLQPMDTRSLLTARVVNEDTSGGEHRHGKDKQADWEGRVNFLEAF
jgi:hypothetical protein